MNPKYDAKAVESNVKLLMAGGLSRDEANIVIDMTAHFEDQLDQLVMRTISAMAAAAPNQTALAGAVVLATTLRRKGETVKDTVFELFRELR